MTDIPIIFSAAMVQALLAGRKTMTRRLAWRDSGRQISVFTDPKDREAKPSPWQGVKPGDRLYVRESLRRFDREPPTAQYVADITGVVAAPGHARHVNGAALWNWGRPSLPSIHMPRWASRLTLIVTATKIERLYDIGDDDIRAEGIQETTTSWLNAWRQLWESIHGPGDWESNPEVVALTFRVIKANIDAPEAMAA